MRDLLRERLGLVRNIGSESGAAIVAAIGVMIICISLGVLIVSQAIASQRDSGRSLVRTVEIHSAEAGVDTLYAKLQMGTFVCGWETAVSEALGPDAVSAKAELKYWDADGNEMNCAGDTLRWDADNVPARAQVLVTSKNERATAAGIEPIRSFESEVLLTERRGSNAGAAIFSASNITMNNPGYVTGVDADVWVDTGNYNCAGQGLRIDGNLYVPEGDIELNNDCSVENDAYVHGDIVLEGTAGTIRGNAYTKRGDLKIPATKASVHGQAVLGGAWTIKEGSVLGGVREEQDFEPFPQSRGLPPVLYSPEDWWDDGMISRPAPGSSPKTAYENALYDSAVANNKTNGPFGEGKYCTDIQGWSLGEFVRFPQQPTGGHIESQILDARECNVKFVGNTLEFYA